MAEPHKNRLAEQTSPYLLQHASNPVDWYPWGPEALERSRAEDKPILLSIGYAACHWCHVMERESFENRQIAELMNRHFVCIKVDREERPDLDAIYMSATLALSGSGGWPMTVFLTPDQRPFFAGTYFPPRDMYGRIGFGALLERIAELWRTERARALSQATLLTAHLRGQAAVVSSRAPGRPAIEQAVEELWNDFDPIFGGFGSAPKFPPCASLSLLLRVQRDTGDERCLRMLRVTLDAMKNGGMYDQLAGGFARYSTDVRWLVPHFEKMLYDNAQLVSVYLQAFQATGSADYARVARESLDYVCREMQGSDGGYFSSTDADSEGEEGKYFVWSFDELVELLGRDSAEAFAHYYGATPAGNWEGTNVLHTPRALEEVAAELGLEPSALELELAHGRETLLRARRERPAPLLDDKVITAWNGLMISGMAFGFRVLGEPAYLESCERAIRFILTRLVREDGGLYRTAREGKAQIGAFLEDYALLCEGLVEAYEAGAGFDLLERALGFAERMVADFHDAESGAFFDTARDHERLIVRTREGHDGALPNANAVAARVLVRLSRHFERPDLADLAGRAIAAYGELMERAPRAFASALSVVDLLSAPPAELVLVGHRGSPDYDALAQAISRHYLPNHLFAHFDPERAATADLRRPLIAGKSRVSGRAALYVCENYVCAAPLSDPARVAEALVARLRDGAGH